MTIFCKFPYRFTNLCAESS